MFVLLAIIIYDPTLPPVIWLMICKNYFRYGKHSISNDDFQAVKEKYKYQERGYSFDVIGKS